MGCEVNTRRKISNKREKYNNTKYMLIAKKSIFQKILLSTLCLLFSASILLAQTYEDVVYLKNGSIIHGIIIEQVPNESLKIKSGQNLFVYKMEEVQKIVKQEVAPIVNHPSQTRQSSPSVLDAENYLRAKMEKESKGLLRFINFEKINGVHSNHGTPSYEMEYKLTFQPIQSVLKGILFGTSNWDDFKVSAMGSNYVPSSDPGIYQLANVHPLQQQYFREYNSRQGMIITGAIIYTLTDNGWRIDKNDARNIQISATNFFADKKNENVDLNNLSANEKYTTGNSVFLSTKNHPFGTNDWLALSDTIDFLGNSNKVNTKELSHRIRYAFASHANMKQISRDSLNKAPDSLISRYKIIINSIDVTKESGYTYPNNTLYMGHKAKITFTVKVRFGNGKNYEKTMDVQGGDPKIDSEPAMALDRAYVQFCEMVNVFQSWFFFIHTTNYTIIEEKRNGTVQKVRVTDVAPYIDKRVFYSALFFTDYEIQKDGSYIMKDWIAKADIIDMKKYTGSVADLKVYEGGQKIRQAITEGKTVHVMFMPTAIVKNYK